MNSIMRRVIAVCLTYVFALCSVLYVSADDYQEKDKWQDEQETSRVIDDPSQDIVDDGEQATHLFAFEASNVDYRLLSNERWDHKIIRLSSLPEGVFTIRLTGAFRHTEDDADVDCPIEVGICYWDASVRDYVPAKSKYIESGRFDMFVSVDPYLPDENIEYLPFIKNRLVTGTISGSMDVYYYAS